MSRTPDDGYVRGLDYTYRYCPELAPSRIALACAARGVKAQQTSHPKVLELAFGQGVSLNLHAAAAPGEYWGFDFNPNHVKHAQALAAVSGADVRVTSDSFESFAAREDVPHFDIIAMHGTWSWISAKNRHLVVEIVRKRLAPGGVCFISYNCLPGWSDELPLRHLMALHAERAAPSEPIEARIEGALAFAQSLLDAGAKYFAAHPALEAWLQDLKGRSRNYLAHEYFNRDWHPMPSSEVARAMAGAGLVFGASSTLALHEAGLGDKASDPAAGMTDPVIRETVLDYVSNTRFRSDLFVKQPLGADTRPLPDRIGSMPFVLLHHPDYVPGSVRIGGTEIALAPEIYRPFAAAMARDGYAPKSLRDIGGNRECAHIAPERLAGAALVLTDAGYLHPAQASGPTNLAGPRCSALNSAILERVGTPEEITSLASPVTGSGVFAARKEMMFLRARSLGQADPEDWARHAWEHLGQGDAAALRSEAAAFARIRLPVFEALGIA